MMNKLIINELAKIFKRKSFYFIFILILLIIFSITFFRSMKNDEEESVLLEEKNGIESELSNYDVEYLDEEDLEEYLQCQTKLDIINLRLEFGENSWQSNVIVDYDIFSTLRYNINLSSYKKSKDVNSEKQYNELLILLRDDDWKAFARYEIDLLEKEENQTEIDKLNYRLEKDISFETSYQDDALREYFSNIELMKNLEKQENLTYDEKRQYQELKESTAIDQYVIDTKEDVKNKEGIRLEIVEFFDNYKILFLLLIIGISSIIIVDEFKTGNIKNLLIMPQKRWKIYIAKIITCFILSAILYIIIGIIHFLVSLLIYGIEDLNIPYALYIPSKSKIITFNIILLYLYNFFINLPLLIINILFLGLIGVVFNEYIETEIFTLIFLACTTFLSSKLELLGRGFQCVSIFNNLDFIELLLGKLPQYEYMSLEHSLIVFVVYCFIFLGAGITVFNKKDIENYN